LERAERRAERIVALVGGPVEAIVRRQLLGGFPNALDRIELGRVRRQSEQFDPMAIRREPELAVRVEVVTRPVVDDQKRLATTTATDDLFEEVQERPTVKHGREVVQKPRPLLERDDAEDVCGFANAERVYAGLVADA
jgi:hypothetical protein